MNLCRAFGAPFIHGNNLSRTATSYVNKRNLPTCNAEVGGSYLSRQHTREYLAGMVSGLKQEAKTKEIKIYRLREGSKDRDVLVANLDLIKTNKAQDVLLQPYDLIEVGKAKRPIGLLILDFAIGTGKAAITAASNSVGYSVIY